MPAKTPPAIVEIGVEHWAEGQGNIKEFLLGGPDVGKTRWSSAFPRPLWLACESVETVAASIATRRIEYLEGLRPPRVVDIRSTDDMVATLTKLEQQLRAAGPQGPAYRTAVVDTLDGFSRMVKDEWSAAQEDGIFTGRDAWSYLEAKMNLVLTRLLALDMNVIVLCHLREKTTGEGDKAVTTYEPFLQGQVKDSIFHDFNLVGLMKYEWTPGEGGDRERKRGISYEPTPTFPFLKDHFHLELPDYRIDGRRCWPVTLDDGTRGGTSNPQEFIDTNYGLLAGAILGGMEGLGDSQVVEVLPESTGPSSEGVVAPGRGGPVAGAPAAPPAKKAAAAPKKEAAPSTPPAAQPTPSEPPTPPQTPVSAPSSDSSTSGDSPVPPTAPVADSSTASTSAAAPSDGGAVAVGPADPAPTPAPPAESPAVEQATPQTAVPSDTSGAESAPAEPTHDEAVTALQDGLGAQVVTEEPQTDATSGSTCPVCKTKDLSTESADLVQLSRLRHRDVVVDEATGRNLYDAGGCCFTCYQTLNTEKANMTGHYAA